jgi:hypothetical protein
MIEILSVMGNSLECIKSLNAFKKAVFVVEEGNYEFNSQSNNQTRDGLDTQKSYNHNKRKHPIYNKFYKIS